MAAANPFENIRPRTFRTLLNRFGGAGAALHALPELIRRNASGRSIKITDRLARGLSRTGFVIVSGLARGIDLAAHRGSLESGTIAVLAGGHGRPYPAEHAPLLNEIAENGAIVSEMPLNWEPRGRDFPRRLCTRVEDVDAVLAPLLGRRPDDLFTESEPTRATQEKLWDELDLFDKGAQPNEAAPMLWSAEEEGCPPVPAAASGNGTAHPGGNRRAQLVSLLGPAPVNIDDLVRAMECPASEVRALLFELEVAGRLARYGGDLVALLPESEERL